MATFEQLFPTTIYSAKLQGDGLETFLDELRIVCREFEDSDQEGQTWSEKAGYKGYTSYGSIDDLPDRSSAIASLCEKLKPHLLAYAEAVEFDLRGFVPAVDSIWINILESGGAHSGHIHANSVISGTLYLEVPDSASPIRFEDPRLAMMIAAPPRLANAARQHRHFYSLLPEAGEVLLWESWLRHEVPMNTSEDDRISISFNAVLV